MMNSTHMFFTYCYLVSNKSASYSFGTSKVIIKFIKISPTHRYIEGNMKKCLKNQTLIKNHLRQTIRYVNHKS